MGLAVFISNINGKTEEVGCSRNKKCDGQKCTFSLHRILPGKILICHWFPLHYYTPLYHILLVFNATPISVTDSRGTDWDLIGKWHKINRGFSNLFKLWTNALSCSAWCLYFSSRIVSSQVEFPRQSQVNAFNFAGQVEKGRQFCMHWPSKKHPSECKKKVPKELLRCMATRTAGMSKLKWKCCQFLVRKT